MRVALVLTLRTCKGSVIAATTRNQGVRRTREDKTLRSKQATTKATITMATLKISDLSVGDWVGVDVNED